MKSITENDISGFRTYLTDNEKSPATIAKYTRDVRAFAAWLDRREADKTQVLAYKQHLQSGYAPASVNSMLSALNTFFDYLGRHELHVRTLKIQRQTFLNPDRELKKREYERLIRTAQANGNTRLFYLIWKQWKVASKREWGLLKLGVAKWLAHKVANWGDHYQFVATKSVLTRAVSKEILTKRGLVSVSDYYNVVHIEA